MVKHRPVHGAILSYSKMMAHILFFFQLSGVGGEILESDALVL